MNRLRDLRWFIQRKAGDVKGAPRRLKWFIQRGRHGWAECDVWSMDYYIARLNVEMLTRLRDTAHGYPAGLMSSEIFGASDAKTDAEDFQKWVDLLDEMINGWKGAYRFLDEYDEEGMADFVKMMPLYTKWFFALWD